MEYRTITFGSILESTPEGLAAMDRIRQRADAERAALEPWERELQDEMNRRIDEAVLGQDLS